MLDATARVLGSYIVCAFHLIDYNIKDCFIKQPEYMLCHYSPELSEPAIRGDLRINILL